MRKENPKIRWHVTDEEKAEIRKLTLEKVRQAEIAKRLGITRGIVGKWQIKMGLPTVPPVPEEEILRLLRLRIGQHRIHKMLNVSQPKVHAVMVKYGIYNGNGEKPKGDIAGFIGALKTREGHIKALVRRFGVGFCKGREIAHEVLDTLQFRPGAAKPPLSSNFPQKHYRRETPPNIEPAE